MALQFFLNVDHHKSSIIGLLFDPKLVILYRLLPCSTRLVPTTFIVPIYEFTCVLALGVQRTREYKRNFSFINLYFLAVPPVIHVTFAPPPTLHSDWPTSSPTN